MSEKTTAAEASKEASHIYGHAGVVTFFTLLSRILGLVRDLVIAHRFGASVASDAWVQAFRIPNALRRLTAEGSMVIAFVPVYVEVREKEGRKAALVFARRVLGLVLAFTTFFMALGMVFSDALTLLFSPGFAADPHKFALTSYLIRWSFPYLVMVSLVAWAMGLLNAEKRFAAPAAAPIFLNLGIILGVVWFASRMEEPIMAVAWGVLAGGLVQVVLQLPSLFKVGATPWPMMGWRHPHLKKLFALMVPSLFGVAVYQVNIIVLGVLASYLPTGQIFYYNNATRLTELVLGVFAFSFTTAGLPTMSEHHARQDWTRMSETLRFTFSAVLFMIIPAMAGLMAAGHEVVAMLYLHGEYNQVDVARTASTLLYMALGMPAVAMVRVMTPAFYTYGDARSPVVVSLCTLGVTALMGWGLSTLMQVEGLALGLSLGTWFQCLLLGAVLRYKAVHLKGWFPWRALGLQSVGSAVMALMVLGLSFLGDWQQGGFLWLNWLVFGLTLVGAVVMYMGLNLALGEPEARHWLRLGRRVLVKLKLIRSVAA